MISIRLETAKCLQGCGGAHNPGCLILVVENESYPDKSVHHAVAGNCGGPYGKGTYFEHLCMLGLKYIPMYRNSGPKLKADLQRKIEEIVVDYCIQGIDKELADRFLSEVYQ